MTVPNPGSDEAIDAGCSCARADNRSGRGFYEVDGVPQFWIRTDCPLHGTQTESPAELDGAEEESE